MDCVAVKLVGATSLVVGRFCSPSADDAVCRCDGLNCWRAWIGGLRMTVLKYVRPQGNTKSTWSA